MKFVGLTLLYFAFAKFGLAMAVLHPSVSSVWPPAAIGVATLLLMGRSCWTAVFAGAALVNFQIAYANGFSVGASLAAAAGIGTGNALEAWLGAWAVDRFARGARAIERAQDLLRLVVYAGLLATIASATLGVASLRATGMLEGVSFAAAWLTWWLGNASGIFIGVPLILAWRASPPQKFAGGPGEAVALALAFGGVVAYVFVGQARPLSFLVLPGIVWTACRYGTRGSGLAALVLTAAAVAGTIKGRGPFASGGGLTDLLILGGFLGTIAISGYAMAALVWERDRVADEQRGSNERLEAEISRRTKELLQAQKMEAIGRLSGAVAHEFNNVLTGVVGLADLIRQNAEAGSQTARDAESIASAGRRGSALAGRLLSMTRRGGERKPVALNAVVAASEKILRLAAGETVDFALELDAETPAVLAAPDQVEQILLNLCLNARDAMGGSGKITVRTRREAVSEARVLSHGVLEPGDYGVLSVGDTGAGVPDDIRPMIFEPFFSTKKAGKGTGLGLSIVYGIMEAHKGAIDLESVPGATEFKLYFPATRREAKPTPLPGPAAAGPRGNGELILVADDDELVRGVIVRVLEPLGYKLLVAEDGEEAWRLYAENASKLSMAVLDVVMPKLKGDEVYDRIIVKNPGFKVLFVSGHAMGKSGERIRAADQAFLAKPFETEKLSLLVREILDRP